MKLQYLLVLALISLCLVQNIVAQKCQCPQKTAYNQQTNQCTPYPSPSSPDYVTGCKYYDWNRDGTQLQCQRCEGQFYSEGYYEKQCFDSGVQHCVFVQREYLQTGIFDRITNRFLSQNQNNYRYYCQDCETGYFMVNKYQCAANPQEGDSGHIEYCSYYKLENNQLACTACQGAYYAKNGQCVAYPTQRNNCKVFYWNSRSQETVCGQCYSGYTEVNGSCQQNPNVQGCSQFYYDKYQKDVKCNRCEETQGYAFNRENSKCDLISSLIDNCVQGSYDSYQQATCLKCRDGYYSTYNSCVQNPQSQDSLYIPHCKWYKQYFEDQLLCVECNENYVATENECHPITQVSHCQKYNFNFQRNQSQCRECTVGFTSIDGSCKQCPAI